MKKYVSIDSIEYSYPSGYKVGPYSLTCDKGDILSFSGPSGVGKTTFLRILAGLLKPDEGSFFLDQIPLNTLTDFIPTHKRKIGLVFQDYALFPHLTVEQNISFSFKVLNKKYTTKDIQNSLEQMCLGDVLHRYPYQLSGGQQQRVSLIRALMAKPKFLLMDEPFASLDADLREKVILETVKTLKEFNMTSLIVTHAPNELAPYVDRKVEIS
ncbi:hypothetical protein AB834_05495 [PVC group bacterium (ex Bugula neritina AB1)]|nr:hypothetical protein AB834_05495 [PVC group bacterium (ex Bugula neritina AB1)]